MAEWTEIITTPPAAHGTVADANPGLANDKFYLLGGNLTGVGYSGAVSAFDLKTKTWDELDPFDPDDAFGAQFLIDGVMVGDTWWFVSTTGANAYHLHSLDTSTGTLTAHVDSGGAHFDWAMVVHCAGRIIVFATSRTARVPRVYHIAGDSWSSAATPPHVMRNPGIAVDEANGLLYVRSVNGADALALNSYDVSGDSWTALTGDTSGPVQGSVLGVVHDGLAYFAGGALTSSPWTRQKAVRIYDVDGDSWSGGDDLPITVANAGVNAMFLGKVNRAESLIAWAYQATSPYAGRILAYPVGPKDPAEPEDSDVTIHASIELPVRPEASIATITVDITGGPGVSSDLLVAFTTGRGQTSASAVITVNVPTTTTWSPPTPVTPPGSAPIIPPRGLSAEEATTHPIIENADEYNLAWAAGSQVRGTVAAYGPTSAPTPEVDFEVEGAAEVSIEWGATPPTTRSHAYGDPTATRARQARLPELMPEAITGGTDVISCLQPVTADLCSDSSVTQREQVATNRAAVTPTAWELLTAAAQIVGIDIVILNGTTGLLDGELRVPQDYRTEGRTFAELLDEFLTGGAAPTWYAPDLVMVHGGGLPVTTLTPPAIRGTSGTIETRPPGVFDEAEPVLEDYLADCRDTTSDPPDPCSGESFETAFTGRLEWTERAGEGASYTEIDNLIVKEGGVITREERVVRRMSYTLKGTLGPFRRLTGQLVPVEWMLRLHEYLPCCPTALVRTTETTWVDDHNRDPDATFTTAPGAYPSSMKEVEQAWHAEGWLRSRTETTGVLGGWTVGTGEDGVTVYPWYKYAYRTEEYLPVGHGMWRVNTTVSDYIAYPVDDESGATVGRHYAPVTNSYVVMTDAAPPQVTCPTVDATDCITTRTAEWAAAHAAWSRKRDAHAANNPSEGIIVTRITYTGRILLTPGTTGDRGVLMGIEWAGRGERNDDPSETTTLEWWGAAPP